ncbi:MAG: FAD-dependent oxidoreductase [Clostridia bacterium]|jgi:thioredoxin reductase/ferredoxin|nr:FAD-dependent oxidoreductase [Clostridia bacterium]
MKRYNLAVIGAGPAGLSAAIEAKKHGMKNVAVFDENSRPGGQLFKQIHKFFGSKEHKAKERGFRIGEELLSEARELGVDVHLNSVVEGIYYPMKRLGVVENDSLTNYSADNVIIATGANENFIPFDGWTLPGVMGAGAAQTMMNLNGVMPGNRILMVGSGNVGLVVSFQLLQAGCNVVAVIDAAPRIGGYGVHASKLSRAGVPFLVSHTVVKAEGSDHVTGATIAEVDEHFKVIKGTEKHLDVDTICMAVGLSPMSKLAAMTGCEMVDKGGAVPKTDKYGATSIEGLYAAGDVAGIEEASSAMITGRISALAAAKKDGYVTEEEFKNEYDELNNSINKLRKGMFSHENRGRTDLTKTDEGYELSQTLLSKGYVADNEINSFPGVDDDIKGVHPVIECTQNIPCNPCQDACKFGCIMVGDDITSLPVVNKKSKCTNCGMCVASCSGQAIFLVNNDYEPGFASVTLPYEFLPVPAVGDTGVGLDRSGNTVCKAEVVEVRKNPAFDHTTLLTIKVPRDMSMKARFYKGMEATL